METETKMSKFNIFTILLIPFVWMYVGAAMGPSLGALAQAFPGSSAFSLRMVMSIPFITSVIFSIVSGKLAKFIDKKTLLICGLFLYGVTGIFPAWATSITQILILRALSGIGVGLVLPLPSAIIAENFMGVQRERYLGLESSVSNISNALISLVIGFLLILGWQYVFYSFAIVFIVMLFAMAGVPKSPPIKSAQEAKNNSGTEEKLPVIVYFLALAMLAVWSLMGFCSTNISLFMTKEHIGSSGMIGVVMAVLGIQAIFSGALLPEIRNLMGKYFVSVSLLVYGAGFVILWNAHSMISVLISVFLIGFGPGILPPYIFNVLAIKVKQEQKDNAYGIVSACIHLGAFISPMVQLLFSSVCQNNSERFLFLSAAIILITTAVIAHFNRATVNIDVERTSEYQSIGVGIDHN
jgi:MFS family permease